MYECLRSLDKTFILLDELEKMICAEEYGELYSAVTELTENGVLSPIKKANGTNGLIQPLYIKYRIIKSSMKDDSPKEEVMHLDSSFNISYYLNNPNKYREQRDIIYPLSEFLKYHSEQLKARVSKNERAYQIWRYEKS